MSQLHFETIYCVNFQSYTKIERLDNEFSYTQNSFHSNGHFAILYHLSSFFIQSNPFLIGLYKNKFQTSQHATCKYSSVSEIVFFHQRVLNVRTLYFFQSCHNEVPETGDLNNRNFLEILEAIHPVGGVSRAGFFRWVSLMTLFPCVFTQPSSRVCCVLRSSAYMHMSHTGIRPTLLNLFYFNYLF